MPSDYNNNNYLSDSGFNNDYLCFRMVVVEALSRWVFFFYYSTYIIYVIVHCICSCRTRNIPRSRSRIVLERDVETKNVIHAVRTFYELVTLVLKMTFKKFEFWNYFMKRLFVGVEFH